MNTKLLTAMALAMTFVGCADVPKTNLALDTARNAVQAADADPNVGKYAAHWICRPQGASYRQQSLQR
jgi:hypothetical protein